MGLGGPLASPWWRFCGFGLGLDSNEKRSRRPCPLLSGVGQGRWGLISVISPWLCLTRGGLEPFAVRPSNLGHLSFRIERGDCHFVTQHEAFGMQQLHEFNVRFNLKRKQDYLGDMSDGKLLQDVSMRGSGPDVCDEVGVTCIRIAILCFCLSAVIRAA